ncbi:hypothetical protein SAMN06295974_3553 [Plantibacter flavus]|uniref:Uncharacterized protein n=1 Tax=Plantibacter flavus TaxID=150123 RepID=A0A3N2C6B4_9MICO|nr:hypothetical protein [Plantibacter flavus]ROR83043.1 hypothetical protein EDD42_3145 [Plantibacter flavus]SMG46749.1 hypothetical protein SAMN06295974_3553 [Plantibacter flavus]
MLTQESVVISRGPLRRVDDDAAIRTLSRDASSKALVIDLSPEATDQLRGDTRITTLTQQVEEPGESISYPDLPLLFFTGASGQEVLLLHITSNKRLCLVSVYSTGLLKSGWPKSLIHATNESLISVLIRNAQEQYAEPDWHTFVASVHRELRQLNALHVSRVIDEATETARRAFTDNIADFPHRRTAFEYLLDTRSRFHSSIAHYRARGLDTVDELADLTSAVTACDALITSMSGMANLVLQEQNAIRIAKEARRDDMLRTRDSQIARLAAAMLAPGLWFAFLGANILPESFNGLTTQSMQSTIASIIVAAFLAASGWLLIPRVLTSRERRRLNE